MCFHSESAMISWQLKGDNVHSPTGLTYSKKQPDEQTYLNHFFATWYYVFVMRCTFQLYS